MAVTRRLRFEILRRDEHRCRYCGASAPDAPLTVDHVIPVALGGSDDPGNLVAACKDCNAGKSSVGPDDGTLRAITEESVRMGEALRRAIEERAARRDDMHEKVERFDDAWETWKWGPEENRRLIPRPADYADSLERWFAAGLNVEELIDKIPKAMTTPRTIDGCWAYLCGIAWRMVTQIQDRAREFAAVVELEEITAELADRFRL